MTEITTINERGALTLPASIRKELGIKGKQHFIVEANSHGEIVLRSAVTLPIEHYTQARIDEFSGEDALIGKWLAKKKRKK